MAKERTSKSGWREQRRQKKRDQARRTDDTPEKVAERDRRRGLAENAERAGIGRVNLGGM